MAAFQLKNSGKDSSTSALEFGLNRTKFPERQATLAVQEIWCDRLGLPRSALLQGVSRLGVRN